MRRRRAAGSGLHESDDAAHVLILVQNMSVPRDRRVWQESCALRDAGFDVSVICPRDEQQTNRQCIDGIDVFTYPPAPPTQGVASFVWEFAYCWFRTLVLSVRVQRRRRVSVIQACNPPDTYFALALLHRPLGTRFVFDQHDLCPEVYLSRFAGRSRVLERAVRLLEAAQYRVADHVVVTNESYRDVAIGRGRREPCDVTVVRSTPDAARMRRGNAVPELKEGRRFLCCWLGIMGPQDGVDLLLRSVDWIVNTLGRTDIQFALLGYGDCLDELREQSSSLGLDPWITFTGKVGPDEIREYLSTADLGLSSDPSSPLNDISTMNKTMEYMAYGLPVVAYDLKETRRSAQGAAVYVRPNNAIDYARSVAGLLDRVEERTRMAEIGRRRIETSLSWSAQERAYVGVFEQVISGRTSETSALAR